MLSFGFRYAFNLRSSLSRAQNAARPSATSFAFRLLSTSLVNYGPSRFVYLGNLPWSLEIEEIKEKAEKFGTLASIDMPDDNGRPAGFSNVEFDSAEDAQSFYRAAIDSTLSFGGRKARVELLDQAQKRVLRTRPTRTLSPPSPTIFIGRIPFDVEDADLHELFRPFGSIKRISIAKDSSGLRRGFGHVEFMNIDAALAAMDALNKAETTIQGQPVHLDFAPNKTRVEDPPNDKLYFSGFNGTLKDLQAALYNHQSGLLDVIMLKNRNGIIQFKSIEEAKAAKEALDQTKTPDGHTLNIYYSNPRPRTDDTRSENMRRRNSYGSDW